MGVDATLFVRVNRDVPDQEIRALRMGLGVAFGADAFWIRRPKEHQVEAPFDDSYTVHHSVMRTSREVADGAVVTMLKVHLMERWFGPGYRRGDWPTIYAMIRYLQQQVPNGVVLYGNDCREGSEVEMTEDVIRAYWDEFFIYGRDHRKATTSLSSDGIEDPSCDFCGGFRMSRCGWGNGYGAWRCYGCGSKVATRDGGVTMTREED